MASPLAVPVSAVNNVCFNGPEEFLASLCRHFKNILADNISGLEMSNRKNLSLSISAFMEQVNSVTR